MMKQQQQDHGKFKESLALNLRQQQPGKSEWQLLGVAARRTHRQCWRKNAFKLKHRQATTTTTNKNKWLWLKWNKNHSHYINDNKYPQSSATAQAALLGASIAATVYCRAPDDAATSTLQRQQNIINDTFTHSLLGSCDCLVSSLCIHFFASLIVKVNWKYYPRSKQLTIPSYRMFSIKSLELANLSLPT